MTAQQFRPLLEIARSVLPSRMPAKTIMWWVTVNVLAMCWYVTLHYKDGARLDSAVSVIYGIAIAAFTGKKIADTMTERRTVPRRAPDTDEGAL